MRKESHKEKDTLSHNEGGPKGSPLEYIMRIIIVLFISLVAVFDIAAALSIMEENDDRN